MSQPAGLEIVDLEALGVEDFDMACEYSAPEYREFWRHDHGPAQWIARVHCEHCSKSGVRLICQLCRDCIIGAPEEVGVVCTSCEERTAPARKAYSSFEPLEKR